MIIKDIIDEDFINYMKPSMFIITNTCSFKCCVEAGCNICQNMDIVKQSSINLANEKIISRYLKNPITQAIVFGGLEPLDQWTELIELLTLFRQKCSDEIIIYTGYTENEIQDKLDIFKRLGNIIIKVGRFIPNTKHRFEPLLGIELASENQYAIKID